MEGVDHLVRFGQHDRVDGGIGGRHVEGAEADPLLPGLGLLVQPGRHLDEVAARQDVDYLVVLDVGDGGGPVAIAAGGELDERRLVQADGARAAVRRLRSASNRALPQVATASLTVCQPQPGLSGYFGQRLGTFRPGPWPTWRPWL